MPVQLTDLPAVFGSRLFFNVQGPRHLKFDVEFTNRVNHRGHTDFGLNVCGWENTDRGSRDFGGSESSLEREHTRESDVFVNIGFGSGTESVFNRGNFAVSGCREIAREQIRKREGMAPGRVGGRFSNESPVFELVGPGGTVRAIFGNRLFHCNFGQQFHVQTVEFDVWVDNEEGQLSRKQGSGRAVTRPI